MNLEIKDLAGISAPVQKLIELVSAGIGSVFRPQGMRKEADAKAYEIRAIAAAEADASVIKASGQVTAELERVKILAGDNKDIVDRAKIRLLSREIEGQKNIESIAEHALTNLPSSVSDQPVTDDWKRKFFLEAENICDTDLQFLWGKVLAGEVSSPGSYSLRTLEILKHLSKQEAELFRVACNLAFSDGWIMKTDQGSSNDLDAYGLNYGSILALRDAGLIYEGDLLSRQYKDVDKLPSVVFMNNGLRIELSGKLPDILSFSAFPFTRAGMELQNLIEHNPCMPYLQSIASSLRQRGLTVKKETIIKTGSITKHTFDEDL